MKFKLFILLNLFSIFISAQYMWQIKVDTVIKWHYYDGDEFDSTSVDLAKWIPAYSYSEFNYKYDYLMTPKRLEFENGICRFMCYRDTGLYTVPGWQLDSNFEKNNLIKLIDKNKVKYLFTAGNVWSKGQYNRGYFEIRFKTNESYGMWPAFWLYAGYKNEEIDFFELKGEINNQIHIDVHCPKHCGRRYTGGSLLPKSFGGWIKASGKLKDDYNVLAGEWQDGYVKWYLNGQGIGYFKGDFVSQKMSLIMGTGPAKKGLPFAPGLNKTSVFPNSLDVDYVRVWYKTPGDKKNIVGKKHTVFSYFKSPPTKTVLKKKVRYMYNKKAFMDDLLTISVLPAAGKKIIITALGKEINYSVSFSEPIGKEILTRVISDSFYEFDFSNLTAQDKIKIKIKTPYTILEETIELQK